MSKTRTQAIDWEEIFSSDISEKGLSSKIYEGILNLNNEKMINPIKNWQRKWAVASLEKIHRWQIACKTAQHHVSIGNCKFKQRDTSAHLLACLKFEHREHQMLTRMEESRNSQSLLAESQNDTDTKGQFCRVYKTKYTLTI